MLPLANKKLPPSKATALYLELLCDYGINWAGSCACAAVDAGIRIDLILCIAHGYRFDRTVIHASATGNTLTADFVRHVFTSIY